MLSRRLTVAGTVVVFASLFSLGSLTLLGACDDGRIPSSCGAIPEPSGCPYASGGSCDDPTCTGLYACRASGHWELVKTCSAHDDAGTDLADAGLDADGSSDASNDAGPDAGCGDSPDASGSTGATCEALQAPDCNVSLALDCPASACSTGCENFLTCTNGVWSDTFAAYCDDDGKLVWSEP